MTMLLLFTLIVSLFTPNDKITLDPKALIVTPAGIKTSYAVSTTPPQVDSYIINGLPQDQDALWSSWGNGCFASNGKYYFAVGDHRGYDGDSFVYEFDPSKGTVEKIIDIADAIGQKKGDYGHGKIHSPIVEYQGALYFSTYWGKEKLVEEASKKGYRGSLFFRFDLKTRKLDNLGPIIPGSGLPHSILDPSRGLLYFYAVNQGDVIVYDLKKRTVKWRGGSQLTNHQYRSFMLSRDGKVYFSDAQGKVSFYDPDKSSVASTSLVLPGTKNSLRAASPALGDGRIFGMTRAGRLFEFNPLKQTIKDLGPNFGEGEYTAVIALSPDEKYLYYAPGAHGSAARIGSPIVQYSIATGTRKVIAYLHDAFLSRGYYSGGSYNLVMDSNGGALYSVFNGSRISAEKKQQTFGVPVFLVVRIPASERK